MIGPGAATRRPRRSRTRSAPARAGRLHSGDRRRVRRDGGGLAGRARPAGRSWGCSRAPTARAGNEFSDVTIVTGLGHARNLAWSPPPTWWSRSAASGARCRRSGWRASSGGRSCCSPGGGSSTIPHAERHRRTRAAEAAQAAVELAPPGTDTVPLRVNEGFNTSHRRRQRERCSGKAAGTFVGMVALLPDRPGARRKRRRKPAAQEAPDPGRRRPHPDQSGGGGSNHSPLPPAPASFDHDLRRLAGRDDHDSTGHGALPGTRRPRPQRARAARVRSLADGTKRVNLGRRRTGRRTSSSGTALAPEPTG